MTDQIHTTLEPADGNSYRFALVRMASETVDLLSSFALDYHDGDLETALHQLFASAIDAATAPA